MAPAITHFLVGASILLACAAPFALRYDLDRDWTMWLVPIGGVWGMLPDFHHVAPIFSESLRAVHSSSWVTLCAFHYQLDTPYVEQHGLDLIFIAVVVFCVALGVYTLAERMQPQLPVAETGLERLSVVMVATISAGGYGGFPLLAALGVVDGYDAVAGLVGLTSGHLGILVLLVGSIPLAVAFAGGFELLNRYRSIVKPRVCALSGAAFGVGAWFVGVVIGVPVWRRVVLGTSDFGIGVHWPSLGGLVGFGLMFGLVYSLISGAFDATIGQESRNAG